MTRRCARQPRQIDGTIFLGCCTFAKIDVGTRRAARSKRDVAVFRPRRLFPRDTRERRDTNFHSVVNAAMFIYLLDVHNAMMSLDDCCSITRTAEKFVEPDPGRSRGSNWAIVCMAIYWTSLTRDN